MLDALEIRLLGPFEVLHGGGSASVSGSKRHCLLALLALRRGRVVPVDALIEALWGEELPDAPRNALQHHVARLRAVLGQEALVATPDGYALRQANVDALRFEELLADARVALREDDARAGADAVAFALSLWRGPALHGLTETPWFEAEARRLEALRVDALEEQFEAALALGEHREIVSALRAALDDDPFRERLWGQLMLALYRSGRQANALEAFHEARRALAEELGLEPGPDLRRLQEAILSQDPAIAPVFVVPRRGGNLPRPITSFVGRKQELTHVVDLLRNHRLVTVTGPPGIGKTRFALEVVRSLEAELGDGAWLVELARGGGQADVARLVASAVGARGPDPLARVLARLRGSAAILVLDACEYMLEEAARVAAAVLDACANVRVLATSREVLHVAGEVRVALSPLSLPDRQSPDAANSPAVQLFAQRAQAARPGFELTPEVAALVGEIARQVDGLPLAIELTAARVNVLGLPELLGVVSRERAASDHETALHGLMEWSYDLLHTDEKTLLHAVAAHRGGASLRSLVAVVADPELDEAMVTYLLGTLVDKSIISVSFPEEEARYDLLDAVRDYVLERLRESGSLAATRKAHAAHFATLADAARTELGGPDWLRWMMRLELELGNLWAALAFARDTSDALVAARLGVGLGWYFGFADRVSEGRAFLETAVEVAATAPLALRVELLAFLCYLATEDDDLEAAVATGEHGLAIAAGADSPAATAMAQLALAFAYDRAGPQERAVALAGDALRGFDAVGDAWGAAASAVTGALGALVNGMLATAAALTAEAVSRYGAYEPGAVPAALIEAVLAERVADAETAVSAYRRALEHSERAGFADHASFALAGLGSVAFGKGDLSDAEAHYRRALAVAEAASASWLIAHARVWLAHVLAAEGNEEVAAALFRLVLSWSEEPRRHQSREALFIALSGSPAEAARAGLARLADADVAVA